jgi:hypothetical protein
LRREYLIFPIRVNGIKIIKIIIDDHVDKHSDHINDEIIKKLVMQLKNERFEPDKVFEKFKYFNTNMYMDNHRYKLVWLLEEKLPYIGIITVFRDRRLK